MDDRTETDKVLDWQRERLAEAWAAMLGTEGGRFILSDILDRCGLYQSTFTIDGRAAWLEGRRSVALELLQDVLAPQGAGIHAQMLTEAEKRRNEYNHARERDERNDE